MKNFQSGGGDPLERIISTEEWRKRRADRQRVCIRQLGGAPVIVVRLPLAELAEFSEALAKGETLADRLRLLADAMDSADKIKGDGQ